MSNRAQSLPAAVASIRDIFHHSTGLPPNLQMYGFRWEPPDGGCPVTWIARQPQQPMPFSDMPRPDLGLTLLVGPKGGAELVVIKATTDEKGTAAMKEREACAAHVERVFCDGSAPVPLTRAYRAVAESIRNRGLPLVA